MNAEQRSITQLVHQARSQVRQVYTLCNRVRESLTALQSGEEAAEGGWRRYAD
ncbi:MAG TPA: hypothetical protein PL151_20880 [Phycisphaerae bacterium]|nr:hypothetical protein [Phycisphaerae bacterium]HOJ74455.1 hypothetical protein [Phycisphaerae bacterium]HOM53348.1 hypothetical protein [Phycisphaerae bacterium]HON67527.1 hypothetical protein [Phycisphaerae bacterium]HOQ86201.1 hypothetical protein [Phycisphaerae bacterium]